MSGKKANFKVIYTLHIVLWLDKGDSGKRGKVVASFSKDESLDKKILGENFWCLSSQGDNAITGR